MKKAIYIILFLTMTVPGWAQQPKQHKHAKLKWLAVALVPHALNGAYYAQYSGCYPQSCIDHGGRPGHFYLGFTVVNVGLNALGYFAKRDDSKLWIPITLGTTPLHIYDLATHK